MADAPIVLVTPYRVAWCAPWARGTAHAIAPAWGRPVGGLGRSTRMAATRRGRYAGCVALGNHAGSPDPSGNECQYRAQRSWSCPRSRGVCRSSNASVLAYRRHDKRTFHLPASSNSGFGAVAPTGVLGWEPQRPCGLSTLA